MASIYSYQKYTDAQISRTLRLPEDDVTHSPIGTELATIDGITYVSLPDGVTLPADQPIEIAASIQAVTMTSTLRDAIKAASPHCRLISSRVDEKIRSAYTLEQELYFARISLGAITGAYVLEPGEQPAITAYGLFVEAARQEGRACRSALGL